MFGNKNALTGRPCARNTSMRGRVWNARKTSVKMVAQKDSGAKIVTVFVKSAQRTNVMRVRRTVAANVVSGMPPPTFFRSS